MIKTRLQLILVLALSFHLAISQTSKDEAKSLCMEAIYLMDNGEIDESLVKLAQARRLDSENLLYVYETALAYEKKGDYPRSIKVLDSIKNHPDAWDQVFQQLGNAYDYYGEKEKALEIYRLGMQKFPESGVFHQEMGNIEYAEKNYNEATLFWEKGLKVDPNYASNYYKLAKLYSFSTEKMWSLIYGELFMLLEPTSARSEEISKLLFETYQEIYNKENNFSSIDKLTNTGFQSLGKRYNDTTSINNFKEPFEEVYFSCALNSARQVLNQIKISTVVKIRNSFLNYWFNQEFNNSYRNKLFDYQKLILEAGMMETYTLWLLAYGDPDIFQAYYDQNTEKVSEFIKWLNKNHIQINRADILSRQDYE